MPTELEIPDEVLPDLAEYTPQTYDQPLVVPDTSGLVPDAVLLADMNEVMDDIRKNEQEVAGLVDNFTNMVINEGDSTTSSKEALVNLLKIKADMADKKTRIVDLKVRLKMKEKNTFPAYLANNSNNTYIDAGSHRDLIQTIEQIKKNAGKE